MLLLVIIICLRTRTRGKSKVTAGPILHAHIIFWYFIITNMKYLRDAHMQTYFHGDRLEYPSVSYAHV